MTNPLNLRNYGDVDEVKNDVKTLNEILSRQGTSLLIDVVAESIGNFVLKFKSTDEERERIVKSVISEFKDAVLERT